MRGPGVGGRQQVADRDRAKTRIDLAEDLADKRYRHAVGPFDLRVQHDPRPEATGTGHHARHAPVIGHTALAKCAGIIDDEDGPRLDGRSVQNLKVFRTIGTGGSDFARSAVEVDAQISVGIIDANVALMATSADSDLGLAAAHANDLAPFVVIHNDVALIALGTYMDRSLVAIDMHDISALAVSHPDVALSGFFFCPRRRQR